MGEAAGRRYRSGTNSIDKAAPRTWSPLPEIEGREVQWARSNEGVGFITAHRDPPAAGGIIAIVTLAGRALFRTVYEVESPRVGERMTLTLRYNVGGPEADYL